MVLFLKDFLPADSQPTLPRHYESSAFHRANPVPSKKSAKKPQKTPNKHSNIDQKGQ
jgi:hypothetical protein